jgi:hypothetical protein
MRCQEKSTASSGVPWVRQHGKSPNDGRCYGKSKFALANLAGEEKLEVRKGREAILVAILALCPMFFALLNFSLFSFLSSLL